MPLMSTNETPSLESAVLEYLESGADSGYVPRSIEESSAESARRLEAIRTERAINDSIRAAIQRKKIEIAEKKQEIEVLKTELNARTRSTG